jgi:hypothetical protein
MLLFALAAQLALPVQANGHVPDVRAIFTADDFPAYLQRAGVSRIVYTRTTVRPDGTTQGCVAETSSGDPKLDEYTCGLIVKRAKFLPATWTDGTAVYGVIRVPVRWMISSDYLPPSEDEMLRGTVPDLELSLDHLPKGAHSITAISLEVAADENGRPITCAEWSPPKSDHRKHFPELVSLACEKVASSLSVSPPMDQPGKKIRSVQSVSVHFVTEH